MKTPAQLVGASDGDCLTERPRGPSDQNSATNRGRCRDSPPQRWPPPQIIFFEL